MADPVDEPHRADHFDPFFAAYADAEQRIEADEMVDVGVGDKDMADAEQVPGAELGQVAHVQEKSAALMKRFDEQGWIAEAPVGQPRVE
jgi:hypothetical protein